MVELNKQYDVIIVGAGPNGLTAGAMDQMAAMLVGTPSIRYFERIDV